LFDFKSALILSQINDASEIECNDKVFSLAHLILKYFIEAPRHTIRRS